MDKKENKIDTDLKEALKNKEADSLVVLRGLKSAIHNKEIENKKELDGKEVIAVIKAEAKKRKDSIEQYKTGKRNDLAKKEEAELKIIEKYLPEEMGDGEIEKIVEKTIKQVGAASKADRGKVMGAVMAKLKGQADGSRVSAIVNKKLNG